MNLNAALLPYAVAAGVGVVVGIAVGAGVALGVCRLAVGIVERLW